MLHDKIIQKLLQDRKACKRQKVKTNATFNAFLLSEPPKIANTLKVLSMTRHFVLEDDTKEYWGFYLLKGSSVTVNTCVRWPGASLIVIRGHRHLHECAYIGDDSSEELDELMEAIKEGTYIANDEDLQRMTSNESITNDPEMMKRHRADVTFHSPVHEANKENYTLKDNVDTSDLTDSKILRTILDALQTKKQKDKNKQKENHPHFKRNSTIAKNETANFNIHSPVPKSATSDEVVQELLYKLKNMDKQPDNNGPNLKTYGRHYNKPAVNFNSNIDNRRRRRSITAAMADFNKDDVDNDKGLEEGFVPKPDGIADHRDTINETDTDHDMSNSEFWSSFSSSEEALLNCEGLILNLPLTPHHNCHRDLTDKEAEETYLANSITYRVPVNGYYFFVFNSENEIQPNYIRVQFHLNKAIYNLSNPVSACKNQSDSCAVDLKFFSSEKLVLELPLENNDTLWNEEFIVESECEPRTALYAICVISVPVIILIFAFS
ncbi:hypothetical protein GWI33_018433 [Rhynchophorus ferrugineus]|uniref:E3 ubiquitin-protein ligase APD1-4 middle domain-containing protein n=1 Tax=Rhynchophorus ferrugineus TaxID=354439 RepID=A0A834M2J3_RHYFE|nr:hypothetical protein GWI33_018433 [Rhynchophorus ferrugineus]